MADEVEEVKNESAPVADGVVGRVEETAQDAQRDGAAVNKMDGDTTVSPFHEPDLEEGAKEGKPSKRRAAPSVAAKWITTLLVLMLVWFFLCTVFYDLYSAETSTPLNTAQAFFYAVDAGLSVGFTVFTYDDDVTMLFSAFNLFIGTSFVTAALSLFIEHVLDKQDSMRHSMKNSFAKADADGDGQLDEEEFAAYLASNPLLGYSEEAAPALFKEIDGGDGSITIAEFQTFLESAQKHPWTRMKMLYLRHSSGINLFVFFMLWWAMGTIYGIAYEGWTFMISQYFAIAAMATAGFVYPSTDTFAMVFTGLYCLFGIPIFFAGCGKLAAGMLAFHTRRKMHREMRKRSRVTDVELEDILGSRGVGLEELDIHDFVCMKLARLGLLDRKLLVAVENEFAGLDTDCSGTVSMEEITASARAKAD